MSPFRGYHIIEEVQAGTRTTVFRALRIADGRRVLLKSSHAGASGGPGPGREFEILQELAEVRGVMPALGVEEFPGGAVLVLEDPGLQPLDRTPSPGGMPAPQFLPLAIAMVRVVGEIHRCGVIHRNLRPGSFYHDPATRVVVVGDFGIAIRLSRDHPVARSSSVLEGSLPYMSPEQTGRVNRALDHRSDYYSLGVTFYELLTGRRPFEGDDPMELVHAHVAREPVPPHQVRSGIPRALSSLVLKLLEKTAERRYRSARGLIADLERCAAAREAEEIELGRDDVAETFHLPQVLYGRESQLAALMEALGRVVQGGVELVWVTGAAGMGKSTLVAEIQKSVAECHGHLVAGKFDQYHREIAYRALIQAFSDLIRQLLTEPAPVLEAWRLKLLRALGPNGRVVADLIPEIELILGELPPVPQLGLTESDARFTLVFRDFIGACSDPAHPMVLFLDDLQWADSATLHLLELLVGGSGMRHLLIVGAYRDDEVSPGDPLSAMIRTLQAGPVPAREIQLPPLEQSQVNALVSESLSLDPAETFPLAELIFAKTQGNPFFVSEFFRGLHLARLLNFDPAAGKWHWDLVRIRAMEITENVVELMSERIQRLPEDTRMLLEQAACAGGRFDLRILCDLNVREPSSVAAGLRPALETGLLLSLDDGFRLAESGGRGEGAAGLPEARLKFSHDRVHQAAYGRLGDGKRRDLHWRIGHLLARGMESGPNREGIFETVHHLNLGLGPAHPSAERREVARFNWMAGCRARASTAYGPARVYFETGLRHLDGGAWEDDHALTLALNQELMQTGFLQADYALMDACGEAILAHGRSVLDRIPVLETRILAHSRRMDYTRALETGLIALADLGAPVPARPGGLRILAELAATRLALAGRSPEDLLRLPVLTDARRLATMRILMSVSSAAYFASPNLFPILVFRMVRISVREGNAASSAFAYVCYGLILCGVLGDYPGGQRFGDLALRILDVFGARDLKSKVFFLHNVFVRHWTAPMRDSLEAFLEGARSGLETGDVEFHSYSLYFHGCFSLLTGDLLGGLAKRLEGHHAAVAGLKAEKAELLLGLLRQVVAALRAGGDRPTETAETPFDAAAAVESWRRARDHTALSYYHSFRTLLRYFRADYAGVLEEVREVARYHQSGVGQVFVPMVRFYESLALLAVFPEASPGRRWWIRWRLVWNQRAFRQWSRHAPRNQRHRGELIRAERARISGNAPAAMAWYARSIQSARESGWIHEEALAFELTGRFHRSEGREDLGSVFLAEARRRYSHWGAVAQVDRLDQMYPGLRLEAWGSGQFPGAGAERQAGAPAGAGDADTHSAALDLASVLKSSQALSGEIVIQKLVGKSLELMMENAGARRGVLILKRDEAWLVEAEGTPRGVATDLAVPMGSHPELPQTLVNYVARTREPVVLGDAAGDHLFGNDPYLVRTAAKSVLGLPVIHQGKLAGLVYLENNLVANAFTERRLEVLQMLSTQAAISLENAALYHSLEQKVADRTRDLQRERDKSEQLLLNVLPRTIAEELKAHGRVKPRFYESATIVFADVKGFTRAAGQMTPAALVGELNRMFLYFDQVCDRCRIEKLKTIGDAYMCAGGLPEASRTHPADACLAALQFQAFLRQTAEIRRREGLPYWEMRIGIHTGPVMAGVIGKHRFVFDVWGDAVNVASRLESSGEPGRISISEATCREVEPLFETLSRGEIHLKDKGPMRTHFLLRIRPEFSADALGETPNERFHQMAVPRDPPAVVVP